MLKSDKALYGPDNTRLDVLGVLSAALQYKGRSAVAKINVVHYVSMPLLGRDVISMLNIIVKVDSMNDAQQQIITHYSQLFTGLGCMQDPCMIQLKPDVQSYAVFALRHIPRLLLPKVTEETDC